MKEYSYVVMAENGLHARPAGALATCARRFVSSIKINALGKEADAKRLLSVMSLGAVCGTRLDFTIEGEDEDEAYYAIVKFCEGLGE